VIVYGRNPVREALRGRRSVSRVWATAAAARQEWLAAADPELIDGAEIERLCDSPDHQGVCADAGPYAYADAFSVLDQDEALVLALDELQDPHNLGAICRVAESAGAAGVVIPERRSAEVTPAVCKASAGAVEHLAVARVPNLGKWLARVKGELDAWVYGAAPSSEGAVPYDHVDYRGRTVLVLGSEGKGLRPGVSASCDALISLPQRGRISSLNVSTAAAALVYGILHLRTRGVDGGT
jgi:23S rRNA (guanosine2251-2'-O)-methyltransferase